jgi:hypothetical protein
MRSALAIVALAGTTGCLRDTVFHCATDSDCNLSSTPGICEAEGFCSVDDRNCASGRAFNEFSGSLSRSCVGIPDAGIDQGRCSEAFTPVLGAPGHFYFLFTVTDTFENQEGACGAQGPSTYISIPDTASELAALLDLGGEPTLWMGITDRVTEGTFITLRGALPTILPWATGQPDDSPPGQDCVAGITADATLQDDSCDLTLRAICECEP